jgi:hypothetical protein
MKRRTFIHTAVGAATAAVASVLPLPALLVAPVAPITPTKMTYQEFCHRQRQAERLVFSKLSEGEKAAAWESRCNWLRANLPRLVKFGQRVEPCPSCKLGATLTVHSWPETFTCTCCGVITVLDRWLPDDRERALVVDFYAEFIARVRAIIVDAVQREGRGLKKFSIGPEHLVDGVTVRTVRIQLNPGPSLLDKLSFFYDVPYEDNYGQ